MSQIRTAKAIDVGAFPGSKFVIDGSPPIAQCQETQIVLADASAISGQTFITKVHNFTGFNLTGKKTTVSNTLFDDGTYNVISNTDHAINTDHTFNESEHNIGITVQDAGQAYLTRNESSFQRFIEDQGKAHTTKGGQVYTDLADPPMNDACSDTWNPD